VIVQLVHHYSTLQQLFLPFTKTNFARRSYRYSAPISGLYSLSKRVLESHSPLVFKSHLNTFLGRSKAKPVINEKSSIKHSKHKMNMSMRGLSLHNKNIN